MAIIDSQVHVYEADRPGRPWAKKISGPPHVTGDEQVAYMDELGIDGAVIVSTFTTYLYDSSYAQEVHAKHPGRFALVRPVDFTDPAVGEVVADWAATPGAVGVRLMLAFADDRNPDHPGLNAALKAGARHGLPVNMYVADILDDARAVIERHPDTTIIIDHVGLSQTASSEGGSPWTDLPKLLSLAQYPNVALKLSAACVLSAQPYPFEDIWDPMRKIIDAYGVERCMWGTDWTRVTTLTYREALDAFRLTPHLSESERAMVLGGALEKIYGWSPQAR
jgi:L-fuconolactonase